MMLLRSRFSYLLLALLACLLLATIVVADADEDAAAEEAAAAAVGEAAEDEDDDDADAHDEDADSARPDFERHHPLTDLPPMADDVDIGHVFTTGEGAGKKTDAATVTLGEPIRALIAFRNGGRSRYHIWGVMGSLNMDHQFSIFVQNFTYGVVNKTVGSGGEMSFSYSFTPNERLDTRSFQLALSVFYEAQSSSGNAIRGHSTTFFNSTVGTKPGAQSMSNGAFLLIVFVSIAAAVGAYLFFRNQEEKKSSGGEAGTEASKENEWLEDHHHMTQTGGGRARKRSGGRS